MGNEEPSRPEGLTSDQFVSADDWNVPLHFFDCKWLQGPELNRLLRGYDPLKIPTFPLRVYYNKNPQQAGS